MAMEDRLLGAEIGELEAYAQSCGEARFRGRQIFEWLHKHGVVVAGQMKNLPQRLRALLANELHAWPLELVTTVQSTYDNTRKYTFRLHDGETIESVLIPEKQRLALCLSTQVGCAMGCRFCRTGSMGWVRDLSSAEIVAQYHVVRSILAPEERITHIVVMGMGEPLANFASTLKAIKILTHPMGPGFSPRRITVSTVGIVPHMEMLLKEVPVNLTVSLNAGDEHTRQNLCLSADDIHWIVCWKHFCVRRTPLANGTRSRM